MITLDNVSAVYPHSATLVLDQVNLHVPTHETMAILGGSGAGKSTVLKAILRLNPITAGRILINGEDCAAMDPITLRRTIGMVFQDTGLFPHLTVQENVGLAMKLTGTKATLIAQRVDEVLSLVGLPAREFARRYPHQLSGGQQQRVAVARALAPNPAYLLMDEPFGALDAINRRAMQAEVKALRATLGVTILFVTHDVMEAVSLGDRLAVMDKGRMLQVGTAREVIERPASAMVQALVGTPLAELSRFVEASLA